MIRRRRWPALLFLATGTGCGDDPVEVESETTIEILPSSVTLESFSKPVDLAATIRRGAGLITRVNVTWATSDSSVAAVVDAWEPPDSDHNLATVVGRGNGSAVITASYAGVSGAAAVTVMQEARRIGVSPANPDLEALGDTLRLTAVAFDASSHRIEGFGGRFVWFSADESVATVDPGGLVTAVGNGTTAIVASVGTLTDSAVVSVISRGGLRVSASVDTLRALGDTVSLRAEVVDAHGNPFTPSATRVRWQSRDTLVLQVNDRGLATAVGNGTTSVAASSHGLSGETAVTVRQRAVEITRSISPSAVTLLAVGDTLRFSVAGLDANGHRAPAAIFDWLSSDEAVAVVDSAGLVTTTGNGTAVVTAESGSTNESATVTVMQQVTDVRISPSKDTLWSPDHRARLVALATDVLGSPIPGTAFTWSSSDERVARVDAMGLVTPVAEGQVEITAWATGSGLAGDASLFVDFLSDREALTALYDAAGGRNWSRSHNWLTDQPISSWYGVTSDAGGRIVELELPNNFLGGRIPGELSALRFLTSLRLSLNGLTGPIPKELGGLTSLKTLDLGFNDLTGEIPTELSHLANLESLDLGATDLTGEIPTELSRLANLESLDLGGTGVTGPIPPELGDLVHLKRLNLAGTDLTGGIPLALANLVHLEELRLGSNALTGPIPPELGGLRNLQILDLREAGLEGRIPPQLGNLADLRVFHLASNRISGAIPPELGRLTNLERLRIQSNKLTGPLPPELGNLANLRTIDVSANALSGAIPGGLGNLANLLSMNLSRNELSGTIPGELGRLVRLTNLSLARNALAGPVPRELGKLASLEGLDIGDNQLSGGLPSELGELGRLKELTVAGNPLTGPIPQEFINLRLVRFNWRGTGLCSPASAAFREWLVNLPLSWGTGILCVRQALDALYDSTGGADWANDAGWRTELPLSDWYGLTVDSEGRVTSIDLPANGLAGTIPGDVQALVDLRRLDLRENRLGATVPGEVGRLAELEELYLSNNQLTGRLPPELGNLSSLGVLDISHNRFAGALPGFLAQMTRLTDFRWQASGLCAPPADWFRNWLASEPGRQAGETCSSLARVSVPAVHLTQASQSLDGAVPLVAGRPALLRVFATADQANTSRPPARALFHVDGREIHRVRMELASARGIPENVEPGSLDGSYNATIPGGVMVPGVEMVVEVDPDRSARHAAESELRVPEEGRAPLDVRELPRMALTIVPVLARDAPDSSVFEWTSGIGPDHPSIQALTHVLPVHDLRVTVREPYVTDVSLTGFGGWNLLSELQALRWMDNAEDVYYGVVAGLSGTLGSAFLSEPVSFGVPESLTFVHELGHTMSLGHTPPITGYDPDYPYPGHSIGVWGYDFRSGELVHPSTPDVMKGDSDEEFWISDYHFDKALRFRLERESGSSSASANAAADTARVSRLLLWGSVSPDGELSLEPAFAIEAPAKTPARPGPYRLEGFATDGMIEFTFDFGMDELGHGDGGAFLFAIPFQMGWTRSLERIVLTGPEGQVELNGDSDQAMALVLDRETGRLRSVLRGEDAVGAMTAAAADAAGGRRSGADTRILVSYGLPGSVRE